MLVCIIYILHVLSRKIISSSCLGCLFVSDVDVSPVKLGIYAEKQQRKNVWLNNVIDVVAMEIPFLLMVGLIFPRKPSRGRRTVEPGNTCA
jgi:hypothetical protein